MHSKKTTTALAAAAVLLAACGSSPDDGEGDTTDPATEEATEDDGAEQEPADADPDADSGTEDPAADDGADPEGQTAPEDPLAGLPDYQELVDDGTFRGQGIVMPVPDGWQFDPMAQIQGQVLASAEGGLQQIGGQAVDVEGLPEPLTFDELVENNRSQLGAEPTVDEDIEIDGATEARQLRYDGLPPQQEGQPEISLLLILADNGDGRLAVFNYAAATDEFEDANAERLVDLAGFDPESDPAPPELPELETTPEG